MSKVIYHADFTFRYTYQYFTKKNGKLTAGQSYGPFEGIVPRIYLEGDEDTIWEDIKKKLGDSETKRYKFVKKEIKNIKNTGKTQGNE